MHKQSTIKEILDFWFAESTNSLADCKQQMALWFTTDEKFDQRIRENFSPVMQSAADGAFENWSAEPESGLALILLLDQFPRNVYRSSPHAFATDNQALNACMRMVDSGIQEEMHPIHRQFVLMPLQHSEELSIQKASIRLFNKLYQQNRVSPYSDILRSSLDYAQRHHDIIARFNRFPHRNIILNRTSSQEELQFLKDGGERFGQ